MCQWFRLRQRRSCAVYIFTCPFPYGIPQLDGIYKYVSGNCKTYLVFSNKDSASVVFHALTGAKIIFLPILQIFVTTFVYLSILSLSTSLSKTRMYYFDQNCVLRRKFFPAQNKTKKHPLNIKQKIVKRMATIMKFWIQASISIEPSTGSLQIFIVVTKNLILASERDAVDLITSNQNEAHKFRTIFHWSSIVRVNINLPSTSCRGTL